MEKIYIVKTFNINMKKEMFSLVLLLSLFLVSFVAAETYSSSTAVAFNSGESSAVAVKEVIDYALWKNVLAAVSLILIIVAASMIYKLRKRKAKAKVKVAKKSVKKKVVKKVSKKRKR
jgi:di/tricarboxylate transporter